MIRISKAGLALLAACLLLGVGAGSASATPNFEAGSYPATVSGSSSQIVIETETNFGANKIRCPVSYDGTLNGPSSTLQLGMFINSGNCIAWGLTGVKIENSGCSTLFHATSKEGADQYKGKFGLSCVAGGSLIITAGPCSVEIKGQEGLSAMDIDDDTGSPNRVTMDFEVSGLSYAPSAYDLGCFEPGTKTNGTISGNPVLLKAVNPTKTFEELGLAVTGE